MKKTVSNKNKIKHHEKSVSICIPAYNEESNIENILNQIFLQKQKGFFIKEVIVSSDGSTDRTVELAGQYKSKGVIVHDSKVNKGQTFRQNEIISRTSTDILVLLNADILLGDEYVIYRLIHPILNGYDLTAQWAKPLPSLTFFQHILRAGYTLKDYIYTNYKSGQNLYTCVGHMRALSKRFYTQVIFPLTSDGEDQFLYFTCLQNGFKYKYPRKVNTFFRLPSSFTDYKNYAVRIFQTQTRFKDVFNEDMVIKERYLPLILQLKGCIHAIKKHPLSAVLYIIMHFLVQQWALRKPRNSKLAFSVSSSTKNLVTDTLDFGIKGGFAKK